MGERDEREVELALHELSRKELVRPARRSSMEGESRVRVLARARSRCRVRADPAGRARPEAPGRCARGWRQRPANGSRTWPTCSPTTTRRRSSWRAPPATTQVADELLPTPGGCSCSRATGQRRSTSRRRTSFYRRALALYEPDDPAAGAAAAEGGADRCSALGDAGRGRRRALRPTSIRRPATSSAPPKRLLDLSRLRRRIRGSDAEEREHLERGAARWSSAIRPAVFSSLFSGVRRRGTT